METLVIKGVLYKKSSVIAEDFGYTTDYVGQLCRSKKVKAQMVGRSWYVDPASVEAYREHRYENDETHDEHTAAADVKVSNANARLSHAGETSRLQTAEVSGLSPLRHRQGFMLPQYVKELSYEADTSDLVPLVKKPLSKEETASNPIAINVILATPQTKKTVDNTVKAATSVVSPPKQPAAPLIEKVFVPRKKQVETLAIAKGNTLTVLKTQKTSPIAALPARPSFASTKNTVPPTATGFSARLWLTLLFIMLLSTVVGVGLCGVRVLSFQSDREYMVLHYALVVPEAAAVSFGNLSPIGSYFRK